jgi:hypothetical protein
LVARAEVSAYSQGRLSSLPVHGTFLSLVGASGDWKVARTGRQECLPHKSEVYEDPHDSDAVHWDHEPLRLAEARSGPRVCDPQQFRFMEREKILGGCVKCPSEGLHGQQA